MLLRRLARRDLYSLFQTMLALEKETAFNTSPRRRWAYAVLRPLYARGYAEDKGVAVFTRALLDRVRYDEVLKLVDIETLSSVVRTSAKGGKKAMEWLLEVGRGLTPQDVEKAFPELLQEFQ